MRSAPAASRGCTRSASTRRCCCSRSPVSLLSGVLFGLVPALRLSRTDLQTRAEGRRRAAPAAAGVWGRGGGLRRLLVVGRTRALRGACSIGAGSAGAQLRARAAVSPGFDPSGVLTLELTMAGRKYTDVAAVHRDLSRSSGSGSRAARRDGGRRRHRAAAEPDVRVGPDHRRRPPGRRPARSSSTSTSAPSPATTSRRWSIPLAARAVLRPRKTPVTRRASWSSTSGWPRSSGRAGPVGKRIRTGGFDVTPDTPWMTVDRRRRPGQAVHARRRRPRIAHVSLRTRSGRRAR